MKNLGEMQLVSLFQLSMLKETSQQQIYIEKAVKVKQTTKEISKIHYTHYYLEHKKTTKVLEEWQMGKYLEKNKNYLHKKEKKEKKLLYLF